MRNEILLLLILTIAMACNRNSDHVKIEPKAIAPATSGSAAKYVPVIGIPVPGNVENLWGKESSGSWRFNAKENAIELLETYGCGCGTLHEFSLEVQKCRAGTPVECDLKLTYKTDDKCEAGCRAVLSFSLKKLGLVGSYYSKARLRIVDRGVPIDLPPQ